MKKILRILSVFVCFMGAFGLCAQDILLLSEDFEAGGLSFAMNDGTFGSNTGNNQWVVNNIYSGTPTYPNTTTQDITNGGTIGFAPTSKYLHIHDQPSGIVNSNYNSSNASDRFAYMPFGICTYGMTDVHISFFYLCEGNATDFGSFVYSIDGGAWTAIGQSQYNNMSNWQYVDISDPAFEDVGSLRFGFRWQNAASGAAASLSYSIDDINIVASYSTVNPVTINVTAITPNPVCQGNFVTIEWELSDTLCDGNYQIQLSNANGTFPSPFTTWVMGVNYPQTSGVTTVQIPSSAGPGDCYRFRINRLSPPPEITGVASPCFEIIECPNEIFTMQPAVTLDTNAVCIGSAIDIPFTSTGVYTNNSYVAQLSAPDGTFPSNPLVIGSNPDNNTYDPDLGQNPGSVGGLVPSTAPGCNYYIRVISTNPDAIGTIWGPFCIQECDITTNNTEDISVCLHDCATDPDGENITIDIDVNSYDQIADYLPGNEFTTQLLSSQTFDQIGADGILGSVSATDDTSLNIHIPCLDSLGEYGLPLGMNYLRVVATESTTPDNALGSLVRLTIGKYRDVPPVITSYEYPMFLPRDTFCVGETAMLMFNPYSYFDNSTYMWSCNGIGGGAPFVSPSGANSNTLFVTLGAPGILTFRIQETNNGCVSPWTPMDTIVVLGDPNAIIAGPTQVCEGDTVHYQVQFSPNTYYSWTTNADPSEIMYQDTSNNEMNIAFSEIGPYSFTINVINQCGSASDMHNVNVIAAPIADAGGDVTICVGDEATLSAGAGNGYSYSWSNGQSNVGNTASINVSPMVTTPYYLTVTGTGSCQSWDTASVIVEYPDPPVALYDSICPGGFNQLTLEAFQAGNYLWETGETTSSIVVQDTGMYALSIEIPNSLCPQLGEYYIAALSPPAATLLVDSICPGGDNELLLTSPISGGYIWNNVSSSSSTYIATDVGQYTLSIFQEGEACEQNYIWNILPRNDETPIAMLDSVCPGGRYPLYLQADVNGQYEWSTGSIGPQIMVNDTGVYVVTIYPPLSPCPRTLIYTIIADTCIGIPDLFVYIPNTFTPDQDGINDVFGPVFSDTEQLINYRFIVFDRWGDIIFETTDPREPWTGNHRQGEYYVQDDVYLYLVTYKQIDTAEDVELKGHVVMIR